MPARPSVPAATRRRSACGLSPIGRPCALCPRRRSSLREAPGQGLLDRAGSLPEQRLFGADGFWLSRRPGERLRRRSRDRLRRGGDRPSSAHLWRGEFVFDPRHYLALIEQKPGALDQAAPLQGWTLAGGFQHLRRLLEARMGNRGKREFIQVLRLMEVFPKAIVAAAATDAIQLGAISFDAVKQLVLAIERRPP